MGGEFSLATFGDFSVAVDRYELWDIAYLTRLSLSLVNEYVEIVNEFKRKKEKAMKEHTKERGVI